MADIPEEITLGPFPAGMNNRAPVHNLPPGSVRNAVNVDFHSGGIVTTRKGLTKVYNGVGLTCGFGCPLGEFFKEGSSLKRWLADNTAETIFEGLTGDYVAYEYVDGFVLFSDGVVCKKIYYDMSVGDWGLPVPGAPTVYGTSGTLDPGQYLAAVVFVDMYGNESGASDFANVTLGSAGGITFNNLPTSSNPDVAWVRLYLSMPNGDILYRVADIVPGTASYTHSFTGHDSNKTLETSFMGPPPACRIIRYFNGVVYVADDVGNIFYSQPMSYNLFHNDNFLQFPNIVDIMEPVTDGIYVAHGNRTEFYAGSGPDTFSPRQVAEYGAVFGTGKKYDDTTRMWYSQHGAVKGMPGGQLDNRVEDNVAPHKADSGSSMIREEDGLKQFVTSLTNPTISTLAAKDFIDAEIIRKG